jgi:hypothetical protein
MDTTMGELDDVKSILADTLKDHASGMLKINIKSPADYAADERKREQAGFLDDFVACLGFTDHTAEPNHLTGEIVIKDSTRTTVRTIGKAEVMRLMHDHVFMERYQARHREVK